MGTVVQRWGNSLGVRIPKALAEKASLTDGSPVDIDEDGGVITIRPVRRRYRLADLLAQAKGRNPHGELDSGGPGGRETV